VSLRLTVCSIRSARLCLESGGVASVKFVGPTERRSLSAHGAAQPQERSAGRLHPQKTDDKDTEPKAPIRSMPDSETRDWPLSKDRSGKHG
jgi:hypothetical protein